MTAEPKRVFNRIKAVLAIKQMTAKDLAARTHISVQTISKWSTNREQPRLDDLYLIASVLQVPATELLEPVNPYSQSLQ